MNYDRATIEEFRLNLPTIRRVAGWSSEKLAELLDVSRATAINLENKENKMTRIQYLAIRKLLELEIEESHNEKLEEIIEILVDNPCVSDAQKEKIRNDAAFITKKSGPKVGSAAIGDMLIRDLDLETILKGKAVVESLLNQSQKSQGGKKDE